MFSLLKTPVLAASYTWDGGGTDGTCGGNVGDGNKWSCALNWSSDIVPTSLDTVTFNGTSTKDAIIDADFGGTVASVSVSLGYTGTITQQRSLAVTGTFTQGAGTYTASSHALDIDGVFTLSAGSFTASSSTTFLASNFTVTGGTFNHNSGTVSFDGSSGTLSCNNITFNSAVISGTAGNKTISSNCSLPLGANPSIGNVTISHSGTLTGSGTLTISGGTLTLNSTAAFSGFSGLVVNSITISGANLNLSTYTTVDVNGLLTLSSGTLTAPSGSITIDLLTITGGTFNHNGGTVIFDETTGTLSCGNVTFNLVVFNNTGTKTVSSNCSLPLGANPTIANSITLSGTLTGTGTLTLSGSTTLNSGASLSGFTGISNAGAFFLTGASINLSTLSSFTVAGNLIVNSGSITLPANSDLNGSLSLNGGTFTAPAGDLFIASTFSVSGSAVFNHNNGTVIFDGTVGTSFICNNVTFNLVRFAHTANTKTVTSSCNLPLGNNPSNIGGGAISLQGTLSGSGTFTSASSFTVSAGAVLNGFSGLNLQSFTVSGATLDLSGYTSFSTGSTFTLSSGSISMPAGADINAAFVHSGGTFNASNGNIYFASSFAISGSAVFNANSGTIIFDGTLSVSISCNNATFNLVQFAHAVNTKTVNSNCNLPLGNNPNFTAGGSIVVAGTLSGAGTLGLTGVLTMNSTGSLSGFNGLAVTSLSISGADANWASFASLTVTSTTTISSGILRLPSGADLNGALNITSGATLVAPPGDLFVAGGVSIPAGATYVHSGGTLVLDGPFNATITCNNTTFNLVKLSGGTGTTKTVASDCSLPLGNDPVIANTVSLHGTLTGTGELSIAAGSLVMNAGAALSEFSGLSGSSLSVAGATVDISSYSVFSFSGNVLLSAGSLTLPDNSQIDSALIITSGTFNAPANLTLGRLTYTAGTFNHNNGTVVFAAGSNVIDSPQTGTDLTLYNLTKTTAGRLNFPHFSAYNKKVVILGKFTAKGTADSFITIDSSSGGQQWHFDPQGELDLQYLNVKDSNNLRAEAIQAHGLNINNAGNNTGWNFGSPTITFQAMHNGIAVTSKQPPIQFTIADPDTNQQVKYQIQVDNNSDFASPEIDETSSFGTAGAKTFTPSAPLADSAYYLQIKATDSTNSSLGFVNANSGNIAFVVDSTAPTGTISLQNRTDSNDPLEMVLKLNAADNVSGITEMITWGDFTGTKTWESFKTSKNIKLTAGDGKKVIYAQFTDRAGNKSQVVSATVIITGSTPIEPEVVTPEPGEGEGEVPEVPEDIEEPDVYSLAIRVVDLNNTPVAGVTVSIPGASVAGISDENGFIQFTNVSKDIKNLLISYQGQDIESPLTLSGSSEEITVRVILEADVNRSNLNNVLIAVILAIFGAVGFVYRKRRHRQ